MAQITTDMIASMLDYAKRGEHYPLTLNETQQLAYLALKALTLQGGERGGEASQASCELRIQGKPYPRTCKVCGLGPCRTGQQ